MTDSESNVIPGGEDTEAAVVTDSRPASSQMKREELEEARARARDALHVALSGELKADGEDCNPEDVMSARDRARAALEEALLGDDVADEEEMAATRERARAALEMAFDDELPPEQLDEVREKARAALDEALLAATPRA
eukprot:TRINITY_DN54617_c0_g1_i1.p2 TRINITY_DN54617_c0_g1~~TRINITY_DN54617_c0_g1_i1.p2  ORF type:complete len:154 (+),score=47.86 TRINITY_DN54617_c0_g1_i1:48-464(+)